MVISNNTFKVMSKVIFKGVLNDNDISTTVGSIIKVTARTYEVRKDINYKVYVPYKYRESGSMILVSSYRAAKNWLFN